MAIIQISRIQHRRGRKLTDTGMPQLSSGEIGWAIDTQELYIGNGAVSEGAPQVGNTKVLTEHDNIFDLADQYKYKETNSLWGNTTPTALTVQQKLDEFVSVASFGAKGDNTNQRAEIQNALDSLYIRANSTKDIVNLYFPAGEYRLDGPVYVPPFARLIGEGIGKTVFYCEDTAFVTCNGSSTAGNYIITGSVGINEENTNQAREISITGMSIVPGTNRSANPCIILNDTANTVIKQVYFQHTWQVDDSTDANLIVPRADSLNFPYQLGIALIARNTTPAATCENVTIEDCTFENLNSAVWSLTDIQNININNCVFETCGRGIDFANSLSDYFTIGTSAQTVGPSECVFENNKFDVIMNQGILVGYGEHNRSLNNVFLNVGNDTSSGDPVNACVEFSNNSRNISDNDFFKRFTTSTNAITDTGRKTYVPEVIGAPYNCNFMHTMGMPESLGVKDFIKLPAIENGKVIINFVLRDYHDAATGNVDYTTMSGTIEAVIINSIQNSSSAISLHADYKLDDHAATYTSGDFEFTSSMAADFTDVPSFSLQQPLVLAEHSIVFSENVKFQITMQVIQS